MSTALRFAWRSPPIRAALLANALIGLLAFNFPTFYASISTLARAQALLAAAAKQFLELGMDSWLQRAEALLQ